MPWKKWIRICPLQYCLKHPALIGYEKEVVYMKNFWNAIFHGRVESNDTFVSVLNSETEIFQFHGMYPNVFCVCAFFCVYKKGLSKKGACWCVTSNKTFHPFEADSRDVQHSSLTIGIWLTKFWFNPTLSQLPVNGFRCELQFPPSNFILKIYYHHPIENTYNFILLRSKYIYFK